jgi:hypothetical protein
MATGKTFFKRVGIRLVFREHTDLDALEFNDRAAPMS